MTNCTTAYPTLGRRLYLLRYQPDWTEEYVESLFSSIGEPLPRGGAPICTCLGGRLVRVVSAGRMRFCFGVFSPCLLLYPLQAMCWLDRSFCRICSHEALCTLSPSSHVPSLNSRMYVCVPFPGQELEVKLIRDRHRGIVAGYGFIDFRNHETAQLVLDTLNGKPIGERDTTTYVCVCVCVFVGCIPCTPSGRQ